MSDSKGPKIDLPDELVAELDEAPTPPEGEKGAAPAEPQAPDPGKAPAEPAKGAEAGEGEETIESLRAERDALQERFIRMAAEFENHRRRVVKERQDLFNYATEGLIKELLETVDNLERALDHAQSSEEGLDAKTLLEGVELTRRALMRALEREGVKVVDAQGEKFDPQVHEAVGQVPTADHDAGTVVQVHQKGYLLKDRLLRPALVMVSKRPDESSG
jgi:molecular chaperone GrpE